MCQPETEKHSDTLLFHYIKVSLYERSEGTVNSVSKLTINPHFLLYRRKEEKRR